MLSFIDNFLNKITMYRLTIWSLFFMWAGALALSFFGLLPYSPQDLVFSLIFIMTVCYAANFIFAKIFHAPSNLESVYITALILALIITPADPFGNLAFFAWVGILAMASKYILAIGKKHIFNPAAFSAAAVAFFAGGAASWWIGTPYLLPFVLIGGILMVRKIRRADLVLSFLTVFFVVIFGNNFLLGADLVATFRAVVFYSAIFFFAFVMLTEPATTPPTKILRIFYGALVGFLFAPWIHFGSIYSTPEMALVIGNIFSYIVSPKKKLVMKLDRFVKIAEDTFEFVFKPNKTLAFAPGQYMEWTLKNEHPDSRGIRRYFTIASSPTESEMRAGIKFYQKPSAFKKKLLAMQKDDTIVASGLAGDFTLPRDESKKLAFIAGGIGITPFRSMIKFLLDKIEKRSIVLFYSNKTVSDIAYRYIFDRAEKILRMKIIYALSDEKNIPPDWKGERGMINAEMIKKHVPDFMERVFYISGPHTMVTTFEKTLKEIGVPKKHVKIDFFPGFA